MDPDERIKSWRVSGGLHLAEHSPTSEVIMTTHHELGKQLRNIISSNDWYHPTIKELNDTDLWASKLVFTFLERHKIGWGVSRKRAAGNASVIKIDDERLRYMLILPQGCYDKSPCDQFYWMVGDNPNNDDHSIHPDQASAYLMMKEFPGLEITDERQEDGSCITRMKHPDGREMEVFFPAVLFDNKTHAKP